MFNMWEDVTEWLWYHSFTLATVVIIACLLWVHRRGTQQNMALAQEAKAVLNSTLSKTFEDYDGELVVESSNIIKLYVSGRQTCLFGIFAFGLIPRQQIVSFLLNSLLIGLKDELIVQIPILNQHPISLTMAIIRKKDIKTLTKKKYPDIKQLCKQYKPLLKTSQNVPQTHAMLVQKVEHYKYFLHTEQDIQIWKEHGRSVKMVYMSDVNRYSRYPMTVRMVINLGKDIQPLVQWLINYVDRMSRIRMSSGQRRQARKRREGLILSFQY